MSYPFSPHNFLVNYWNVGNVWLRSEGISFIQNKKITAISLKLLQNDAMYRIFNEYEILLINCVDSSNLIAPSPLPFITLGSSASMTDNKFLLVNLNLW